MLVTYPFKRGERYRQNPCQKRQSTKKNILFHIEIFDLQHTVIMKIQFELDWSDLNDCSTKEVPYIIYPNVIKILKFILNLHSFVILCKYLKKLICYLT